MVSSTSLVDLSCLTSLVAPTTSMVATQVCQSQLVGRSEDSLIGVPVHSSRVGAVPVSSEGPSSILDVSAGAVVSISSAASMVGQGSKVSRDYVSPLVSFAQPIVSSVVSVDELDNRVRDLDFSIEVIGSEIKRDSDGLALSSRNVHLSPEEREKALSINRSLFRAKSNVEKGQVNCKELRDTVIQAISEAGGRIDYAEIVDQESLEAVSEIKSSVVFCIAA
ncbi:hypothetical protein LWI29_034447 [Acer saccharum]|uniref:Pantoate--beta-alanine ligase n=1 Tax=Acer saccharum TaxID=4024 RepID=A0AA39S263_ACESA|nr:hypothetical protein LWI29_034447 [Acer saccharum]